MSGWQFEAAGGGLLEGSREWLEGTGWPPDVFGGLLGVSQ